MDGDRALAKLEPLNLWIEKGNKNEVYRREQQNMG